MSQKEQEVQGKYKFNFSWITYIPIVILLGIVPLIVRLVKTDIPAEYILYVTGNNIDMFSQYKSSFIFMMVITIGIILFLTFNKDYMKWEKSTKIYYIVAALFVIMTALATWLSPYKEVSVWGLPNRAEGGVMIICYIIIMLYSFYVMNKGSDIKFVIIPLVFLIIIMTVLGIFQYKGEDLFFTEWGKKLIIPEHYAEDRALLNNLYSDGNMYGTLFHYNYMGSFAAMMLPLFLTLTCFVKGMGKKAVLAVTTLGSAILLFGSTSRAGLIGVACSAVVFIIIFLKYLMKKWKVMIPLIIAGVALVIGLDLATNGAIFSRIPTLFRDMVAIIQPADESFDYRDHIPVRGITHSEGQATIEMNGQSLTLSMTDEGVRFEDQNGEQVLYIYFNMGPEQVRYFTQDKRFEPFMFHVREVNGENYLQMSYSGTSVCWFSIGEEGIHLVDQFTKEPMELEEVASIGFKGKERLGSARGYIWSRTLPLIKERPLLGYGPDAFAFAFPQNDLLGKWYAYETPSITVDKPHNLYLQIAVNQGLIALGAFLVLVGTYIVNALKVYAFRRDYSSKEIIGIALFLAVIGYLGAGIFNDSVVSVAPIFWILLGTGMGINYMVQKEQKDVKKKIEHATIDMKSRKHV